MIVIPIPARVRLVDDLKIAAPPGLLSGKKCHLFKSDSVPNADTVLADLEEADYDGYAVSAVIVWGPTFVNAQDQAVTVSTDTLHFPCTGGTKPQVIFGYYIADDPATTIVFAERFASPVPVNGNLDSVVLVPTFAFGG